VLAKVCSPSQTFLRKSDSAGRHKSEPDGLHARGTRMQFGLGSARVPACWFRRLAETILNEKVREPETASPTRGDACAPQIAISHLPFTIHRSQSLLTNRREADFPSGGIAQLVERQLCKLEVRGSNPLASSLRSHRRGERGLSRRASAKADPSRLADANAASYDSASPSCITCTFFKAKQTKSGSTQD
jgi:hypothetical protein